MIGLAMVVFVAVRPGDEELVQRRDQRVQADLVAQTAAPVHGAPEDRARARDVPGVEAAAGVVAPLKSREAASSPPTP
jgi:hypothetical protein